MFFITVQMVAIAIDNVQGYIYWSDNGKHTINRAELDRPTDQTVIVNAGWLLSNCLLSVVLYFTRIVLNRDIFIK